jgi:hypothetical protein
MVSNASGHGFFHKIVEALENMLVFAIAVGVLVYIWNSVPGFFALDWSQFSTFEIFIQWTLAILIAIEIIRLIKIRSLRDIFYVGILLLARKSLDPANTAFEIIFLVIASIFVASCLSILLKKKLI